MNGRGQESLLESRERLGGSPKGPGGVGEWKASPPGAEGGFGRPSQ